MAGSSHDKKAETAVSSHHHGYLGRVQYVSNEVAERPRLSLVQGRSTDPYGRMLRRQDESEHALRKLAIPLTTWSY